MDFSPAILLDIALVGVVVFTVAYYMRRGFLAGLLGLVGNLASLALAWFISGRVSPTLFENFFKSGLIDQTAQLISEQGAAGVQAILDKFSAFLPASLLESITQQADSIFHSGRAGYGACHCGKRGGAAGDAADWRGGVLCGVCAGACGNFASGGPFSQT